MNILDYILEIPSSYENNFVSPVFSTDKLGVYHITITSAIAHQKTQTFRAIIHPFNINCELVFFNFKPYQKRFFFTSNTLYIKTIFENKNGYIKAIQPIAVSQINEIKTKYAQKKALKSFDEVKIELKKFHFSTELEKLLLEIHFPNLSFVEYFAEHKSISLNHIKALKYLECFNYQLKLSKKRFDFVAKDILLGEYKRFLNTLPFTLTGDQSNALDDICKDLSSQKAAKRIIVGDVGSGKTILILASAFMAFPKRSVLLAPTTVLANQIYDEAKKYLSSFMNIALFTNKIKPKDDLSNYQFIIGTHALLYEPLPDISLVMIDEQHRFGTNQRNLLDKLHTSQDSKKPHFLQFSATPIPRTQAMIESCMVDFSFLRQTPFEKDIDTKIIEKQDFKDLIQHIKKEVAQNHQTIIVYPLVEINEDFAYASIQKAESFWQKNFENVFATHGKDKEKEKVLEEFRENGSILLATTLIEVGISLPRLTTIVIVGAERMGLATLHQLRGRVSRNGLKGYCYLYTNKPKSEKLNKFCDTTNGFEIAELDLELRSSGDMLDGTIQSGNVFKFLNLAIDKKIIERATKDLKIFLVPLSKI